MTIVIQTDSERCVIVKDSRTLNAIGKKFNLTFDTDFKYCISDAYLNDIGERIPMSFKHRGNTYKLKYFSGCFNPFLVRLLNEN